MIGSDAVAGRVGDAVDAAQDHGPTGDAADGQLGEREEELWCSGAVG